MENNSRWSHEDSIDVLKSIYCLYHLELLGYNPSFIPMNVQKDWFVEQLKAFDWYANAGNCRQEAKANHKTPKPVKKSKPKSPFQDETK